MVMKWCSTFYALQSMALQSMWEASGVLGGKLGAIGGEMKIALGYTSSLKVPPKHTIRNEISKEKNLE